MVHCIRLVFFHVVRSITVNLLLLVAGEILVVIVRRHRLRWYVVEPGTEEEQNGTSFAYQRQ